MDDAKHAYFVAKYRALDTEDLREFAKRIDTLAEEAAQALGEVLTERGHAAPPIPDESGDTHKELSPAERGKQAKLSSDLWNGRLSKRVQGLVAAQGLVFAFSLLGPQGLRWGAIWIVGFAALLMFGGRAIGKKTTRSVCANAETTIEAKTKALRELSYVLWPTLLLSSGLGVILARVLRAG